ncbi:hypothetical protein LJR027_004006 [Terrabacter sp. LjRoot27]|uniref:hypothetical protein n=1 Tax=Terrabacter sp. LjRoot27 TaxID=3342306 RepID=UPI003ECC402C
MPFLDTGRPAPDATAGGSSLNPRAVWLLGQAKAGAERAREHRASLTLDDTADAVLSQIERLEVQKARLEGRLVDAYAALHSVEEQQLARLTTSTPVPITADQVAAQEIACATGVGATEVARRLELATAPRRHRVLRERLRAGAVSLQRALRVVVETRALGDEVLPDLEATVLAPAPDGSVASARLFATRLQRCVRSADSRAAEERRRSSRLRRTAYGRLLEDGMGLFTVVAPAERVVGVLDRVDALARPPERPATTAASTSCAATCSATSPSSVSCRPARVSVSTRGRRAPACCPTPRPRPSASSCRSRSPSGRPTPRASCPATAGSPPPTPGRS